MSFHQELAVSLRHDNVFFGFRQHLYMMVEALWERPDTWFAVGPTSFRFAIYCWGEFQRKAAELGLFFSKCVEPCHRIAMTNGSTVQFLTSDNQSAALRGTRYDFYVVKELNRKDW